MAPMAPMQMNRNPERKNLETKLDHEFIFLNIKIRAKLLAIDATKNHNFIMLFSLQIFLYQDSKHRTKFSAVN